MGADVASPSTWVSLFATATDEDDGELSYEWSQESGPSLDMGERPVSEPGTINAGCLRPIAGESATGKWGVQRAVSGIIAWLTRRAGAEPVG